MWSAYTPNGNDVLSKTIDLDIWHAARTMIDLYDLDAGWRAGLRADQLLDEGDGGGYHVWVRIVRAIKSYKIVSQVAGV